MTLKRPKFLIKEDAVIYHENRKKFLTSSSLKDFEVSPALCHGRMTGKYKQKETPAMAFGTAFHSFVLERAEFHDNYINEPDSENFPNAKGEVTSKFRLTTAYKEWKADIGEKKIISSDDLELIKIMNESIKGHPKAKDLLSSGWSENVIRSELHGVPCQIRIDHYSLDGVMADIKTCQNIDKIEYEISGRGYHTSAAFYRDVFKAASGQFMPPKFYLIVVEKIPPYRTQVWDFTDSVMEMCGKENHANIIRFKKCMASGVWPLSYDYEEIKTYEYI